MDKEEFVMRLKDPLRAEAMDLDKLVTDLAEGNIVETIPGSTLLYITIFMDKSYIQEHETRQIEYELSKATKYWWLEGAHYVNMNSQITIGFRAR